MRKKLIALLAVCSFFLIGCQSTPDENNLQPATPMPTGNDEIKIESPLMNEVISSPLSVKGEVKGYWMFEAIFDTRLEDENGKELATAPATALDDWMTEDFVPFEAEMEFNPGNATEGKLIFLEAFPSGGLEEGETRRTFEVPVRFVEVE